MIRRDQIKKGFIREYTGGFICYRTKQTIQYKNIRVVLIPLFILYLSQIFKLTFITIGYQNQKKA